MISIISFLIAFLANQPTSSLVVGDIKILSANAANALHGDTPSIEKKRPKRTRDFILHYFFYKSTSCTMSHDKYTFGYSHILENMRMWCIASLELLFLKIDNK